MTMENLPDLSPDELNEFWFRYQRGRHYKEIFPEGGRGRKRAVADLANYASNLGTAKAIRLGKLGGDIERAKMYEDIAERIYAKLPAFAKMKTNPRRRVKRNPIKGPGKFEGETYLARWIYDTDGDEDIGSTDELGWFRRFSGKVKGRGPFHVIVSEDSQGFVYGQFFKSEAAMLKKWAKIERAYENYYDASGDDF